MFITLKIFLNAFFISSFAHDDTQKSFHTPEKAGKLMAPGESSRNGTGDEGSSRPLVAFSRSKGKQTQSWVLWAAPLLIGEFLEGGKGWQIKGKAESKVDFFLISCWGL